MINQSINQELYYAPIRWTNSRLVTSDNKNTIKYWRSYEGNIKIKITFKKENSTICILYFRYIAAFSFCESTVDTRAALFFVFAFAVGGSLYWLS